MKHPQSGLFAAHDISKSFTGPTVLDRVSLSLLPGRIHTLVGENGAGKSTLMRIFAGVIRPDSGTITVDGQPVAIASPRAARKHGITFVSQELALVPGQTVAENVFAGRLPTSLPGIVSKRKMSREFAALCERTGVALPPGALVGDLSNVQREFVEILRAVAGGVRLLILDEPTTATTQNQADQIYALMRKLAAEGVAVVLISHDLDDVLRISDDISVLRDGKLIKTVEPGTGKDDLITLMIGRTLRELYPPKATVDADVAPRLEVENLCCAGTVDQVSLHAHPGEVVGIAGLVGSGRTEVLRAIAGADRIASGRIVVQGNDFHPTSVKSALRKGIALIPEDRKQQGLHLEQSIRNNITLPHLGLLNRGGFVSAARCRTVVARAMRATMVKADSAAAPVSTLSGGNQQRVLFAKWMVARPDILLIDEPTRGVDVKGKQIIYQLIADIAKAGTAIVVVSSEASEIIGLCNRVTVLHKGRMSATLAGDQITEDALVAAAFGHTLEDTAREIR